MPYQNVRRTRITRTATYTSQYPDVCWMNISFERMQGLGDDEFYYFECTPGNLDVIWKVKGKELREFVQRCTVMVNPKPKYSFYIHPKDGVLHTNANKSGHKLKLILCQ